MVAKTRSSSQRGIGGGEKAKGAWAQAADNPEIASPTTPSEEKLNGSHGGELNGSAGKPSDLDRFVDPIYPVRPGMPKNGMADPNFIKWYLGK